MKQEAIEMLTYIAGYPYRQPMIFGISDRYAEAIQNISLAAGNNTLEGTAVPAGRFVVITGMSVAYQGTMTNVVLNIGANLGGTAFYIVTYGTGLTSGRWYAPGAIQIVLKPGDKINCYCTGATLNDDLYLRAFGYYFDYNMT